MDNDGIIVIMFFIVLGLLGGMGIIATRPQPKTDPIKICTEICMDAGAPDVVECSLGCLRCLSAGIR